MHLACPRALNNRPVDATAALDGVTLNKDGLKHAFYSNLFYVQGKIPTLATRHDYYLALALDGARPDAASLDQHRGGLHQARLAHRRLLLRRVLMGPHLGNNVLNLGLEEVVRQAMTELGLDTTSCSNAKTSPVSGNGGLGRLAACFLDSLATLEIPTIGYGIRYEFGIFQQEITDGWQVEKTTSGCVSAMPGKSPVRNGRSRSNSAATPNITATSTNGSAPAGCRNAPSSACPTTHRSSATTSIPQTPCACGARRPPSRSTSRPSTAVTTTAPSTRRSPRRTSPRSCIRTTRPCRARSCAWSSSSSSCAARCRTCCGSSRPRAFRASACTRSSPHS